MVRSNRLGLGPYTERDMEIEANLQRVRDELDAACSRGGRAPGSVRLMAVSKVHPVEFLVEAYNAGQRLFGENRVQEVAMKFPSIANLPGLEMHLIGPLQNNKTARAVELFQAVDTLDSAKTAARLNTAAEALGRVLPVLIEVKLSHEESKHGLAPEDLPTLLEAVAGLPHLRAAGLMTVPPITQDPEQARPYFRHLRELQQRNLARYPTLTELSMGMSGDFAVAVEEGSTTVRVGTAIFGKRVAS